MRFTVHFLIALAVLCAAGCGTAARQASQSAPDSVPANGNILLGAWSSFDPGAEVIFRFEPGNTMSCEVPDADQFSFSAEYAVDLSHTPATLDLSGITASSLSGGCLAIVRFPEPDIMEFVGSFGSAPTRPTEFAGGTDPSGNLFLRFTRE